MQFSSKEDIEAPIDAVFDMLSEFEAFERMAIRRGVDIQRADTLDQPGVGMSWDAAFKLRGKARDVHLELVEFDRPNGMQFQSESAGLSGLSTLELVSLSPRRTRISIKIDLKPKTLAARLLIQSLRLAKGNLTKRFKLRVADFAKDMEERQKRRA